MRDDVFGENQDDRRQPAERRRGTRAACQATKVIEMKRLPH